MGMVGQMMKFTRRHLTGPSFFGTQSRHHEAVDRHQLARIRFVTVCKYGRASCGRSAQ